MEIYLIRHTAPAIEKGICYGQTDLELADSFAEEAEVVLKSIPKSFDKVYSSPLQRCSLLAALIDENYITDARLMELNFGDWELKKWEDISNKEIQPWYDDWVNYPAKNGESYVQLHERVVSFFEEIPKSGRIAIVCHAAVIRSLWTYINNRKLKDSFDQLAVDYGVILRIIY